MKSRTRYSLIAAGIVAFIVLTPVFYLFIRGEKYDSQTHRFIRTGSLSVNTTPKKADIFLNGESAGKSNKSIRFLTPGDYNVEVKKEGYFTWSKRINIREQYVSWVNQGVPTLTMFFSEPKVKEISSDVINFSAGQKRLVYLTKNKIFVADSSSPQDSQEISLPKDFSALEIIPSPDERYYLIYNSGFYGMLDADNKTLTDITSLLNGNESALTAYFAGNDDLYELSEGTVYKIDWKEKIKLPVLKQVIAFYPGSKGMYYISAFEGLTVIDRQLEYLQYNANQPQILLTDLPNFHEATLFLTDHNQLFILGDSSLYSIGSDSLNRIADYVDAVYVDNRSGQILFSSGNEINLYNTSSGSTSFVTRSTEVIKNPIPVTSLGWVFYQSDGRLQNIETDNRDHQNNYTFANVNPNAKYWVNETARNIFLLNDGKLTSMEIR